jgi:hypothetical protein
MKNLKNFYILVALGVLLGIFGFVRTGSIIIALSTGAISYLRYQRMKKKRRVELVIPIALAVTLFVVALTLPHGK